MARNGIFKNGKSKLILVLLMVATLSFSMFAVACNDDNSDEQSDRPTYSYTETDDGALSNPNFSLGTYNIELTSFPLTSPTGWSRSKDSDSDIIQSSATSGVINVSSDAWTELLNSVYEDDAILDYVYKENGIAETEVIEAIKADTEYNPDGDEDYKPSDEEIQEYAIENYIKNKFVNPGTHSDASDNAVYMLNNYRAKGNTGLGTSQKITSASKITLEKGSYGKFSVWIKTANLSAKNTNYGANIRVLSTFNGETQADYVVKNIREEQWKKYIVYVEADDHFDTTVQLALGLGYELEGLTQGTVYFDEISFEEIEEAEYKSASYITSFTYGEETLSPINAAQFSSFAYSLKLRNDYLSKSNLIASVEYTKSNTGATAERFSNSEYSISSASADSPYGNDATVQIVKLTNTGVTLTYKGFKTVDCKNYSYVSFYVKNQLSKFGSNNVSFNVYDKLSGKKDIITKDVTTVSTIDDEWQHVGLVIKNNFENDNDSSTTNDTARSYIIEVVIGPTDVANAINRDDFASGEVYITSPMVASGTIYDSETDAEDAGNIKNYNLYNLYSSISNGTVALYAGLQSDFTAEEEHNHYSFSVAPSDVGSILTHPAVPNGYQGIVSEHIYVKEGGDLETRINTRVNGENGSYAGLINSKYINNYSALPNLESALKFNDTEDENIQPLMIYNATQDNYGFIGTSNSISASSRAKVSVTLRVVDQAKATVYLVNTTNQEKSVVTFKDFTDINGIERNGENMQLYLTVDSSMMKYNGWVTVDFYIATGASSQDFRVEVWNGTRDASTSSKGYVFIKDIHVTTSGAFDEASRIEDTFTVSGNPLYTEKITSGEQFDEMFAFEQKLTELEKQYNSEQDSSDDKVSYRENYVWAKNDTMIYAVYNTIDPVENDPYANDESEEETASNCAAETDPSTFWLSLSSILLGVALVAAIIMLLIKTIRRRRKANASDAKSHYTITSRTKKQRKDNKVKEDLEEDAEEPEEVEEVTEEETSELESESEENKEDDSYVYGDVQVFGNEDENKKD